VTESRRTEVYAGVMSGTSLDGVDAVLVELGRAPTLIGTAFLPFPKKLKAALVTLQEPRKGELDAAARAGNELSHVYAAVIGRLLGKHDLSAQAVRAVGCHGQTVRHRPESGYTLQLCNPARLAEQTGITVVADFRARDIAAGGQGAPLVPAFHAACFRDARRHRVIANLGGIANVTNLPPRGAVTGFDTGPGNILLDAWVREKTGLDFDRGGRYAKRGRPVRSLLEALLGDPYFRRPPPKSTGRDYFNLRWLRHFRPGRHEGSDVQATLAELTARSIRDSISRFCPGTQEVYLCGGGVRNADLVRRISRLLTGVSVATTEQLGIHPDWVEAVAFAWLAQRTLRREAGNLPEVTGATGSRVLGAIYAA